MSDTEWPRTATCGAVKNKCIKVSLAEDGGYEGMSPHIHGLSINCLNSRTPSATLSRPGSKQASKVHLLGSCTRTASGKLRSVDDLPAVLRRRSRPQIDVADTGRRPISRTPDIALDWSQVANDSRKLHLGGYASLG